MIFFIDMRRFFMMILFLALSFSIFATDVDAEKETKILFIGNSYTFCNDLPSMIKEISITAGKKISVDSYSIAGATFRNHCAGNSMQRIKSGGYDIVVLQEQSQLPSFPDAQFEVEVFPWAKMLVDTIYEYNDCVLPMFYMTWGRKNGDASNGAYFPVLSTYEGMDSMLYERYMLMKDSFNTAVSPVGRVWRYIRANYPSIELYQNDESHPSLSGSYAAALTFYSVIFNDSPFSTTYNPGVSGVEEKCIKTAVEQVVVNNYDMWKRDSLVVDMEIEELAINSYKFSSLTPYAGICMWDFGDGEVSDAEVVEHTYRQQGDYQVIFKVGRCADTGFEDSISVKLSVSIHSISTCGVYKKELNNVVVYSVLGVELWRGKYSDFIRNEQKGFFIVKDVENEILMKIVK